MQSIEVPLNDRSYPVLVGSGILGDAALWDALLPQSTLITVSDDKVAPLYLEGLKAALGGRPMNELVLPYGEVAKTVDTWSKVIDHLAQIGAGRDACIIALGGGVVGDLSGFAAASWMRGVDFIQAPTTLLAQVDASVGGKTGVNHPLGKNLVGAFHQPLAVVADIDTLATLADREYRAGLAEVVKYGAICDANFLAWLEARVDELLSRDSEILTEAVTASVRYKAEVVASDELETGLRAVLNFGHSFAHALETLTGYQDWLHGEAVAMGMVAAARLSEQRNLAETGLAARLRDLLQALQLPVDIPPNIETADILDSMLLDKKNRSGRRRLVLLRQAGSAVLDEASTEPMIRQAIEACR